MHLYVVASGAYSSSYPPLAGETWAFGVRFVPNSGAVTPIGSLPSDSDVYPVAATINRNETNWTIVGNWTLEMGVNDLDPGDWLNDQLAPALVALFSTAGLFTQTVVAQTIKVYPIGADGRTSPAAPFSTGTPCTLTFKSESVCDGAAAAPMLPPQTALVASLRTPQVGPSGRGRIFLPGPPSSANGTSGQVLDTQRNNYAAAVATFLESCTLNNGTKAIPAVVPRAQSAPSVYAVINNVRVGNRWDTQRRRRRSLVETFANVEVDNP